MNNEIDIFKNLALQNKVEYISRFYQVMIKKTDNPEYINKFQSKIDEINTYKENELNNNKLILLYERIMWAKEKTKQRKMEIIKKTIEENQQKIATIESNEYEEDPDEYLAKSMAQI